MGIIIGKANSNIKRIAVKNFDGTVAGHITITSPAKKKVKRLRYNFKEISVRIVNAKTSSNARKAASNAHTKVALLRQKIQNEEYDSKELQSALAHALKMEKIAKKKMRHLQQEERIRQKGDNRSSAAAQSTDEPAFTESADEKELSMKEEELERLMQEYEKLMQEAMAQNGELLISDEFLDEMMEPEQDELCSGDLELLKKKHRAEEQKEITEADLKYLKAMFERLARETQDAGNSIGNNNSANSGTGVSLELSGMEVPVQLTEMPVTAEGGGVDVMV